MLANTTLVWIYISSVLTLSFGIGTVAYVKYPKESKAWQLFPAFYTFLPAATALVVHRAFVGPITWDAFALRLTGHWHYYLAAVLVPMIYTGANAVLQLMTDSYDLKKGIKWMEVAALLLAQQLVLVIFIAGEEVGWRGFLQNRLIAAYGLWPSIVLMGTVWGLWHAPLALKGYNLPQHPKFEAFVFYPFLCICYTCMLTLLSVKTGSIVPAILFHTTNNNLGGASLLLFDKKDARKEICIYFGIGLVMIMISYLFLRDLEP